MRGKIFVLVIIALLLLSLWPYLPLFYQQKPSEHDPFDSVPEDDVVPGIDSDGDTLRDIDEKVMGTDPWAPDSDGDGLKDGYEYRYWQKRYEQEKEDFPFGILQWLRDLSNCLKINEKGKDRGYFLEQRLFPWNLYLNYR